MGKTFLADYDLMVPRQSETITVKLPVEDGGKRQTLFILGESEKQDMVKQSDWKQWILCDKDGDFYEASVLLLGDTVKFIQIRSGEEPDKYRSGKAIVHNMRGR